MVFRSLENPPIFNRRYIDSNGCFAHCQMVVLSIVHFQMVFSIGNTSSGASVMSKLVEG